MSENNNLFKIAHNNLHPMPGSLLISEPFLQNSYFQRSVVLLVEHEPEGSMGFVLNKKTHYVVNTFFHELKRFADIPIYLGGPVSANRLFFIHSLGRKVIPGALSIAEDLYFDGEFEALKDYIQAGNSIEGKVKFFLGYSGWTKGQLGLEIEGDSWIVTQRENNHGILLAEDESYWKQSLELLGKKYQAWAKYPKDPLLN